MMETVFRKITQQILKLAGGIPLQVFIHTKRGMLVRFTNNGVHQNNFQDLRSYTLRLSGKPGSIHLESNDFSKAGMRDALRKMGKMGTVLKGTGLADKIDLKVPPPEPSPKEYFPFRWEKIHEMAAGAIGEAVRMIRGKQASANGYYSAYERFFYLADSSGLEAFHPATAVRFGVTATKGAGKGYLSFYHPDARKLKVSTVVQEAMGLAEEASRREISLSPGEYECVLSPRAFLELIEPLRRHFDRNLCEDKKSVFSGLRGKKIFSRHFTLTDDVGHAGQFGVPFDAEGAPKRKVSMVQRGVLKELLAEGHSTRGLLEHPFYPENLVVEKGKFTLEEIVRQIRRGIFINKIWYHTLVRQRNMEVSGLATAGSVYIERGKIRGRVIHLRYHDSLFSILNSVVGVTKEQILLKDGERGAALLPYLWISRLRVV